MLSCIKVYDDVPVSCVCVSANVNRVPPVPSPPPPPPYPLCQLRRYPGITLQCDALIVMKKQIVIVVMLFAATRGRQWSSCGGTSCVQWRRRPRQESASREKGEGHLVPLWNNTPVSIRPTTLMDECKRQLKTHLFRKAFWINISYL